MKISLKEEAKIIQQKGRQTPIHLRDQVADEIQQLTKNGYLEKAPKITEGCL